MKSVIYIGPIVPQDCVSIQLNEQVHLTQNKWKEREGDKKKKSGRYRSNAPRMFVTIIELITLSEFFSIFFLSKM